MKNAKAVSAGSPVHGVCLVFLLSELLAPFQLTQRVCLCAPVLLCMHMHMP